MLYVVHTLFGTVDRGGICVGVKLTIHRPCSMYDINPLALELDI